MEVTEAASQLDRLEEAASRFFRHLASRTGGESGLSPSQRLVLRALNAGRLQVSDVAGTLGVTLSAATGLVDRMARASLVTRERDRGDRRVVWVKLTPEGRRVLAGVESVRRQVLAEVVQPLAPAELNQLVELLERLHIQD